MALIWTGTVCVLLACSSPAEVARPASTAPTVGNQTAPTVGNQTAPTVESTSPTSEDQPTPPAAAPAAHLDPAPFDAVLRKHVRGGRVDYGALAADQAARGQLTQFLKAAASMSQSEPLSSWLNVYNALVIDLVLERYPIASVMDVPDFFKSLRRPVAGAPRTLDEIEHQIIRKRFPDARVHVALNCGAVSCPALQARAFREADLDANLTALARAAMADPRHVELRRGKLHVSALFFWFQEDFVRDAGSVLAWIKRYAPPKLQHLPDDTPLVQRDYDWKLAEARAQSPR